MKRRALLSLILVVIALTATGDLLLVTARGARAPAWAHWWCSASALHSSSQNGQGATTGLMATLLGSLRAVLPHWPHILPIAVALATLIYLRRANARYHAYEVQLQAPLG